MSAPDVVELAREGGAHFVGIGGAGMCALAELVLRKGGRVSGCDLQLGPTTERLAELGVDVAEGHAPGHVEDVAVVVVTSAVPDDHPELRRARELGLPVLKRARALGAIANRGTVVAVAGTHGKTSTTAMATELLAAGGLDPTGLVGGTVPAWTGNLRYGAGDLYVVEADEYDRSFHELTPDLALVTNLEADHLDVYGDLAGVRDGFRAFLERVRPSGRVAVCADDPEASRLLPAFPGRAYSFGLSAGSQLRAVDVEQDPDGTRFRVVEEGRDRGRLTLPVPGLHNLRNALAAVAAARHLDVGWAAVADGLAAYEGVGRRFDRLGESGGVAVVDDYAHHPTEIVATLEAVRSVYPGRRIVAVFQPHLFSRTRNFAGAFGRALASADRLWITDVFPAREKPIPGVTGELVAGEARGARPSGDEDAVRYHASLDGLAAAVGADVEAGDVVVTMGAGSIHRVGAELLRYLKEPAHA